MLGLGYLYVKVKVFTFTFSGSVATNPLGRWSLYDVAFKCVHQESEEAVWALGCSLVEPVQSRKWSEVEPEYCGETFWSLLLMS